MTVRFKYLTRFKMKKYTKKIFKLPSTSQFKCRNSLKIIQISRPTRRKNISITKQSRDMTDRFKFLTIFKLELSSSQI